MESNFLQQAPIYGRSCGKGGEMRGLIQIEQLGRVILGVNNPIIWVFLRQDPKGRNERASRQEYRAMRVILEEELIRQTCLV
jgi:hypothetical protein